MFTNFVNVVKANKEVITKGAIIAGGAIIVLAVAVVVLPKIGGPEVVTDVAEAIATGVPEVL